MPIEPIAEIATEDLTAVTGGLGLRNAAYAGFVAASFLAGSPAGPLFDARAPISPAPQTIVAK